MFLLNSRYSLLCAPVCVMITHQDSLSRSYEVILPSSFNIIILTTLVYSTNPPVYSLGYGQYVQRFKLYKKLFSGMCFASIISTDMLQYSIKTLKASYGS